MPPGIQSAMDSVTAFPWDQLIQNLAAEAPQMMGLVKAIAFLLGIIFFVTSLVMAAKSANPSSRADHGKNAWLWSMVTGVLMMALPETISSVAMTLFGGDGVPSNPMAYWDPVQGGSGKLAPLLPLLQIVGLIAVIRGLVVFRTVGMYGNHSKGNASVGRGLVLIIAGVMLVHMQNVLKMISGLTGLSMGANLF